MLAQSPPVSTTSLAQLDMPWAASREAVSVRSKSLPTTAPLTFLEAIDFHAHENPELVLVLHPKYNASTGELTSVPITALTLKRAVRNCISWLEDQRRRQAVPLQRLESGEEARVIGLLCSPNLLYEVVRFALVALGYTVLCLSPRNSLALHQRILARAHCGVVLQDDELGISTSAQEQIRREAPASDLLFHTLPALEDLISEIGEDDSAPLAQPYSHMDNIACLLQTSGSTASDPKLIPQSHRYLWSLGLANVGPTAAAGDTVFVPMPLFHIFGMGTYLLDALMVGLKVINMPQGMPISVASIKRMVSFTRANHILLVPVLLEGLWIDPEGRELLCSLPLKRLGFGGGHLDPTLRSEMLAKQMPLVGGYGATEIGHPCSLHQLESSTDSETLYLFREGLRFEMRPFSDGHFELLTLRGPHGPALFNTTASDGTPAWATGDVFVPETGGPRWKLIGRKDDLIIHANGEKTSPVPIEQALSALPHVEKAVLFGKSRPFVGALIQTSSDAPPSTVLREQIANKLHDINSTSPSHSRLMPEMLIFCTADRPLPITLKGTVQRNAALALYKDAIESSYNFSDDQLTTQQSETNRATLPEFIQACFSRVRAGQEVASFDQLDSLSSFAMRQYLLRGFMAKWPGQDWASSLEPNVLYLHPSSTALVEHLAAAWDEGIPSKVRGPTSLDDPSQAERIEAVIEEFRPLLRHSREPLSSKRDETSSIVIVGSTGFLGSHLLVDLHQCHPEARILCLNRPRGSAEMLKHQEESFQQYGLPTDVLQSANVEAVRAKLDQAHLGLGPDVLDRIRSARCIIYNAWLPDFNLPLSAFKTPFLVGLVNIINVCISLDVRLVFVSSVASQQHWREAAAIPEQVGMNSADAVGIGYGESKYVAERLIQHACSTLGLDASVLRIGQLSASSKTRRWNTKEWLPMLVSSVSVARCLPDSIPFTSFLPVDVASSTMVDILEAHRSARGLHVRNIASDVATSWALVCRVVQSCTGVKGSKEVEIQNAPLWLSNLATSFDSQPHAPSVALFDFFQRSGKHAESSFAVERTRDDSQSFREGARGLDEQDVRALCQQLQSEGLL